MCGSDLQPVFCHLKHKGTALEKHSVSIILTFLFLSNMKNRVIVINGEKCNLGFVLLLSLKKQTKQLCLRKCRQIVTKVNTLVPAISTFLIDIKLERILSFQGYVGTKITEMKKICE